MYSYIQSFQPLKSEMKQTTSIITGWAFSSIVISIEMLSMSSWGLIDMELLSYRTLFHLGVALSTLTPAKTVLEADFSLYIISLKTHSSHLFTTNFLSMCYAPALRRFMSLVCMRARSPWLCAPSRIIIISCYVEAKDINFINWSP